MTNTLTRAEETSLITSNIEEYLKRYQHKELLRFVTVGSVDDGKSTLIGRLLHDSNSVHEDQLNAVKKASGLDGEIDFSLITDGLKAEREQGITIDVAYRYFSTAKRKFIIADTPGHVQYTRNMATGASTAQVAIILIDARLGVLPQSRRHAYIASLLGISHLLICVNKMDLKSYSKEVFESIKTQFTQFAKPLGFLDLAFFPISALKGDNIVTTSSQTPWFKDGTVLNYLETVKIAQTPHKAEFAFPIQYVNRPNLNFRGYCGTLISGIVRPGDEVITLPSGKKSKVKSLVTYDGELKEAFAPQAITITLTDEIDSSRGDVLTHPKNTLHVSRKIEANLVWMNEKALKPGVQYLIKHTTNSIPGVVTEVEHTIDVDTLKEVPAKTLNLNDIGKIKLTLTRPLIIDKYKNNHQAGAFIMIDRLTNATVGAGMITDYGADEQKDNQVLAQGVTPKERSERFAQKACTIWFTGLPGSGKIILARSLEKRLFDEGHLAYVLDPDKNAQLDRHAQGKHLEKSLDLAHVSLDLGCITLATFTSALREDREIAKKALGKDQFLEIFVDAKLSTCQDRLTALGRNPKEADMFYEKPSHPDLVIEAEAMDIEKEVDRIVTLLKDKKFLN